MEELANRFVRFARQECCDSSPLYDQLSIAVAQDKQLLEIAANARTGQPVPNLFFASVQYLLMKDPSHALAAYYPSVARHETPAEDAASLLHDFALLHKAELIDLLKHGLVQTNEVKRAACLLPAFQYVFRLVSKRQLHLIEIGSSAGLNLLFDYYFYDYQNGQTLGKSDSPLKVVCQARGQNPIPLDSDFPKIKKRLGVDLNPLDVNSEDSVDWLKALIWPEHSERRRMLSQAVEIARQNRVVEHIRGDGVALLPGLLSAVDDDVTALIFHSFTVNQMTAESVQAFEEALLDGSAGREVYCVSIPCKSEDSSKLKLATYFRGKKDEKTLAHVSDHGSWIEWL